MFNFSRKGFSYRTSREFGHFVRVLVDVDLSLPLPKFVMLKKHGGAITVFVSYENLP